MEIQTIRELLSQGETGQALDALIAYLEQDARYKSNFLRTLRVLSGKFNAVRQKELKGILPFNEAQRSYNETNDALLAILDDLEAGRVPAETGMSRSRNFILAALGLAMLALVVFTMNTLFGTKTPDAPACPVFENQSALHILVLPFDSLSAQNAPVELRIQESISSLTQKAEIEAEVRISQRRPGDLSSLETARSRGAECRAGLVIYGQYLASQQDSIKVKLGYVDLKSGGKAGSLPFNTFRDITEVGATRDFQDAVFSLCAMLAINAEKWEFARRWMDKIREKETGELEMADWLEKKTKVEGE